MHTSYRYLVLLVSVLPLVLLGQADPLTLSDTLSFSSGLVGASANQLRVGNRTVARYTHSAGQTILYRRTGQFRHRELNESIFNELQARFVDPYGNITEGPELSRQFTGGYQRFGGTDEYIAWLSKERPLGDTRFQQLYLDFYDAEGQRFARHKHSEYEVAEQTFDTSALYTSRYGSYVAVASLMSRRRDQVAVREEGGGILTITVYSSNGEEVFRRQDELPDRRSAYRLKQLLIDESGHGIARFTYTPWRALPPQQDEPLYIDEQIVRFEVPDNYSLTEKPDPIPWTTETLTSEALQVRSVELIDQEPLPACFVYTTSFSLADPTDAILLATAGEKSVRRITFSREAMASLPEQVLEPARSATRKLSAEYGYRTARLAPDGKLWLVLDDRYMPIAQLDPFSFQWRRVNDGLSDGLVLMSIDLNNEADQQAYAYMLRQRGGERPYDVNYMGVVLVPTPSGYGLLHNQDPDGADATNRRRQRFTSYDFARPMLAQVIDDELQVDWVEYDSPYNFPPLILTNSSFAVPEGICVGFQPAFDGFVNTVQCGFLGY